MLYRKHGKVDFSHNISLVDKTYFGIPTVCGVQSIVAHDKYTVFGHGYISVKIICLTRSGLHYIWLLQFLAVYYDLTLSEVYINDLSLCCNNSLYQRLIFKAVLLKNNNIALLWF